MDSDTDCIIADLNLEDIIDNNNIWNHLTMRKQISPISLNVTQKIILLKSKNEITDKQIFYT